MSDTQNKEDIKKPLTLDLFNPKKAELMEVLKLNKDAVNIEIVDAETRDQVHKAQMAFRDARTSTKELWKSIRDEANKFCDKVIEREKEILAEITPIEEKLKAKKEAYDQIKENERKQKELEAERKFDERQERLIAYGYAHPSFELKVMEDSAFESLLEEKKQKFELAEAEKARQEKISARKDQLFKIWVYLDDNHYVNNSLLISRDKDTIESCDDDAFEAFVKEVSDLIEKSRQEARDRQIEQEKKEKELKDREDAIKQKEAEAEKARQDKIRTEELEKATKDAEAKATKETEERIKREQEEKERKEKAEAEKKIADDKLEQEKLEKMKRFKAFKESIGYTEETKDEFTFIDSDEWRTYYKKCGFYSR